MDANLPESKRAKEREKERKKTARRLFFFLFFCFKKFPIFFLGALFLSTYCRHLKNMTSQVQHIHSASEYQQALTKAGAQLVVVDFTAA